MEGDLPVIAAEIALVLVAGALGYWSYRTRGAGSAANHSHASAQSSAELTQAAAEVRELMDRLGELSTQIDKRVDVRLDELNRALSQAQERVARLEALLEQNTGRSKGVIRLGQGAGEEAELLSRQGLDAVEIARRMNVDVGEVELILNLQKSQRKGQA